jgi:hypothetical protein
MLCPIRKPPSFPSKTPIPSGGASEGRCLVIDREEHDEADRSDEADDEERRGRPYAPDRLLDTVQLSA